MIINRKSLLAALLTIAESREKNKNRIDNDTYMVVADHKGYCEVVLKPFGFVSLDVEEENNRTARTSCWEPKMSYSGDPIVYIESRTTGYKNQENAWGMTTPELADKIMGTTWPRNIIAGADGTFQVESSKKPGEFFTVATKNLARGRWAATCNCPHAFYRKTPGSLCKHSLACLEILEEKE